MEVPTELYDRLVDVVSLFNKNKTFELEAKCKKKLSSTDFTNVIKYLRSIKYDEINHPEMLDIFTSNYRISIEGKDAIQSYCKTNKTANIENITVITKKIIPGVKPIIFDDVNFKIDLKNEVPIEEMKQGEILTELPDSNKGFRLKKRYSYVDKEGIIRYDLTIVKSSKILGINNDFVAYQSYSESGTSSSQEEYEIEIELIKRSTKDSKKIAKYFLQSIVELYSVLSNEEFLIFQKEKDDVLQNYLRIVLGNKFNPKTMFDVKNKPKSFFIGPQPVTLEQKNIIDDELGVVTIKKDYTVTEKADGERMLLFISNTGKCYYINNRLDVKFTGVKVMSLSNTILDGEYVSRDIINRPIKVFAVFDIYWDNGNDIRFLPLIAEDKKNDRYTVMKNIVSKIKDKFESQKIEIFVKEFKYGENIFEESKTILDSEVTGKFKYYTDGLIFTPKSLPVGGSFKSDKSTDIVSTWNRVFKWKPPKDNTIDFLVTSKEDYTVYDGNKYKVIDLFVGYNPVQWEPINPLDYLEDKLKITQSYIAKKFMPGDVSDAESFSKSFIKTSEKDKIYCKNGDEITNNCIVEFAYSDEQIPSVNRWVPLRVRYDKTDMFKRYGLSGTANDYGTAMNIWKSIRYPVTKCMIIGDKLIEKKDIVEDDIYYYRVISRDKFASKSMLDFHNYWIKNRLLFRSLRGKAKTLFDVSCGKGGDIPKWIDIGLNKVLGVDISKDNIENPVDGAYARTLQNKRFNKSQHNYVYATLDSSRKFQKEYFETIENENDKRICKLLWNIGSVKTPEKYKGFATNGFDVVSCQFSIHYFFENENKLDNLLWNVNQHLSDGGYFIGTCLDGMKIKQLLKGIKKNEAKSGIRDDRVLWHIRKLYDNDTKVNFGDTISVYMESIGKEAKEYLVNFQTLVKKLEDYNIKLLSTSELKELNITHTNQSFGTFDKEFSQFDSLLKTNGLSSENMNFVDSIKLMTEAEKTYSFMNMWFIFKKNGKGMFSQEEEVVSSSPEEKEEQVVVKKPVKIVKKIIKQKEEPKKADEKEPEVIPDSVDEKTEEEPKKKKIIKKK